MWITGILFQQQGHFRERKWLHAENIDQWRLSSVLALGADMWHVGMKLDTSLRLSCAIRSRCASDPSLILSRDTWL